MEEVKKYLIREINFRKDRKFERLRLSEEREDIFCESCKSRPGNSKNYWMPFRYWVIGSSIGRRCRVRCSIIVQRIRKAKQNNVGFV